MWLRDLLDDLGFSVTQPTPLYLDSKAALDLAADPVAFKKTKHILRHAYELRDRVARRCFAPEYVKSADQLADILTKPLPVADQERLTHAILGETLVIPAKAAFIRCANCSCHECSLLQESLMNT